MIIDKTITAENQWSDWATFGKGEADLDLGGTFAATVTVERRCKNTGGDYGPTVSFTFAQAGTFILDCNQHQPEYRVGVATGNFTSGPVVARLAQSV